MPRRIPVCFRCNRRPTYNPIDAWFVVERAPNSLPLLYQRRWCSMCITEDEAVQRRQLLRRREELRRLRGAQATTPAISAGEPTSLVDIVVQSERRFGVEIEFLGARDQVAFEIAATGEDCRSFGYTHAVTPHWKIVSDASIHGAGGELVSPILSGRTGMQRLHRACRGLAAAGARNNRSTGLHVHHEVSGRATIEDTLRLYAANQHLINDMLAPSRRNNTYCQTLDLQNVENHLMNAGYSNPLDESQWRSSLCNSSYTRHQAVNVNSLQRYGTLEFRQHQGTVNFERISMWVRFGQAMIDYAARLEELRRSTGQMLPLAFISHEEMFRHFNMFELDIRFWNRRIAFFASRVARVA